MAVRRLGAVAAVAVALSVVVGLATWWRDAGAPASQPVASVQGAQLDRSATVDPGVADHVRDAVTRVLATGCGEARQGTATLLDLPDGPMAVTNQHVVAGASHAVLDDPGEDHADSDVTVRVADRDAVHLDPTPFEDAGAQALPIGPRPVVGSSVMVAGYPGGAFRAGIGRVVQVERRQGYGGTVDMLIIDVQAVPGISGGVVVDAAGRAVGVVAARDPQTGDTVAYPVDALTGATEAGSRSCSTG